MEPLYYLNYKQSRTTKLFDKVNLLWYIAFLPDFWMAEVKLPKTFQAIYNAFTKVLHYVIIVFGLLSVGSFLTQHDLTPEQQLSNVIGFASFSTTVYRMVLCYYRDDIRKIIYYLTVHLKESNDEEVELKMIRKIKMYANVFISASLSSMIVRGITSAFQVYRGEPFVTFITIWPDVKDPSKIAEIARYFVYLMWYIVLLQTIGTTVLVMIVMLVLSHQYENLTSYFNELDGIFKSKRKSQVAKEKEYEEGLLKGLQLYTITLWCVGRCQYVFKIIYNLHLIFTPFTLSFLLPELLDSEVDTRTKVEQLPVLISILACLGFFMWPAGDITVEASKLPEGLYGSGWQNCYGRDGVRVRRMIVFAMQQAQQPVVLRAFNIFELSYKSYVTIVKASYSLFSMLAI